MTGARGAGAPIANGTARNWWSMPVPPPAAS